jgi:hypothetical protein
MAIEVRNVDVPYTVVDEPWPSLRGNHRIHLYVEKPADVVCASVLWRRLDPNPEEKAVLIYNPQDVQVLNTMVAGMSAEITSSTIFRIKT